MSDLTKKDLEEIAEVFRTLKRWRDEQPESPVYMETSADDRDYDQSFELH